ncbi:hypothetical protein AGDE_15304 [Angomonas deanei]|nr:hypothetical protein AGDE_15304 [Angomonas deanei]|eukprot:EPY19303.1 hypothetical protein AGDE_15304 [Angomonas deanei]
MERSELKQKNNSLEEKYTELKQDHTELTKKYTELHNEHTELQAVNDALKREIKELKEEKRDYAEEMNNIYDRKRSELEEALKDIARLRKEHSDYEREMTATIKKVQRDLADALKVERNALLDKYYDLSTCECDLIAMYKYCKVYRVPEDVRLSVLAEDTRKELTLPATLEEDIRGGSVREFLEWMVVPLPELKAIIGNYDIAAHFYVQYKKGIVPLPLLKPYCKDYGVKGQYNFTKETLLTVTAVGTCLEYFTTVLPLLGGVTSVDFSNIGQYTLPEDRRTMIGGGSVREFLTTVVDLLPEPNSVKGFYGDLNEYYLAYKAGDISHDVLKAYCYGRNAMGLPVGTSEELSAGIPLGDNCKVMLPLLPNILCIIVGREVDNIDWCATLPERITMVMVNSCTAIKDFTPLLAMKGLRAVSSNKDTNPSLKTIIDQLKNKGVTVKEW